MTRFGTKDMALAGMFTALVAAGTMTFSVYVPATRGFFNVGEIMVYTAALVMGPFVGAFAGGVGSGLADLLLGYGYYAPGTMVIKGAEGFIVGYLGRLGLSKIGIRSWRLVAVAVGLIAAFVIWNIGTGYFAGDVELTAGIPENEGEVVWGIPWKSIVSTPTAISSINVPQFFWVGIAALAFVLIIVAGFSVTPRIGWVVLAILIGGAEMVTGYFLYQAYALQLGVAAALVEIPINIGQVTIGLLVGVPLARSVMRIIPRNQATATKN